MQKYRVRILSPMPIGNLSTTGPANNLTRRNNWAITGADRKVCCVTMNFYLDDRWYRGRLEPGNCQLGKAPPHITSIQRGGSCKQSLNCSFSYKTLTVIIIAGSVWAPRCNCRRFVWAAFLLICLTSIGQFLSIGWSSLDGAPFAFRELWRFAVF